jgi:hypothetical protein
MANRAHSFNYAIEHTYLIAVKIAKDARDESLKQIKGLAAGLLKETAERNTHESFSIALGNLREARLRAYRAIGMTPPPLAEGEAFARRERNHRRRK